jgi:hypothetical protein
MMSEEYPIMMICGLPMILICEIMITIYKKSEVIRGIRVYLAMG